MVAVNGYQLWWPEESSALGQQGMLLLVAVEPASGAGLPGRALPCRVLGTLSPGCPAFPGMQASPAEEPSATDDAANQAARLLTAIGVPANLLGCAYLRTAVALVLTHPEMRRGMMRVLYPQVAQRHAVSARSVERAIRNAIAQTWARGGDTRCRQLLGRLDSSVSDRPTNAEFISMLADHLSMTTPREETVRQIW